MIKRLLLLGMSGLLLALSIAAGIVPMLTGHAAADSALWLDQQHIQDGGTIYTNCFLTAWNCMTATSSGSLTAATGTYYPDNWVAPTWLGISGRGFNDICHADNIGDLANESFIYKANANTYDIYTIGSGTNCLHSTQLSIGPPPQVTLDGAFVDHQVIKLADGSLFTDGKTDGSLNFYNPGTSIGSGSKCAQYVIQGLDGARNHGTEYAVQSVNGTCQAVTGSGFSLADVNINPAQYDDTFAWTSATSINSANGQGPQLIQTGANSSQFFGTQDGCDYTLTTIGTDPTHTTSGTLTYKDSSTGGGSGCSKNPFIDSPKSGDAVFVAALSSDNVLATSAAASSAKADASANCELVANNPASWIFCPVIDIMTGAIDGIYAGFLQPMLKTVPIVTSATGDPSNLYKVWSNFRIYGDIFLVIALLVIVFGQSIGGGAIDAYTVKKVLPRILISAILINLSIYIVALMVDISNIVGTGIQALISQPFNDAGKFAIKLNGGETAGLAVDGATVTALVTGVWLLVSKATISLVLGKAVMVLLIFVLLPAVLTMLAILVTVIVYRGAIIALILAAPLAAAAWSLDNTSSIATRYVDTLRRTLLVYPIIALIFGLDNVLVVTMNAAAKGFLADWATPIVLLVVRVAPLGMIPFAFGLAGGIAGRLSDVAHNFRKRSQETIHGNANDPNSLRNRTRSGFSNQFLKGREQAYDKLMTKGRVGRLAARGIGGYNLKALRSAETAKFDKEMEDQNRTGDDTEQRALTADQRLLSASYRATHGVDGMDYRTKDADGNDVGLQLRTLGGKWVDENNVRAAYARWGGNQEAMQWTLRHEMGKANTQEEQDYLATNFGNLVGENGSWQMSKGQRAGLWTGAAYAEQNANRQWKHYKVGDDGHIKMGGENALALFREIDEKQGGYAMMQQNADTWTTMSKVMESSRALLDSGTGSDTQKAQAKDILFRGARIAHATRSSSMASAPTSADGGTVTGPMTAAGRDVGAGAAGRVQEEITRFTQNADTFAGVYQPPVAATLPRPRLSPEDQFDSLDRRESDRPNPNTKDGAPARDDIHV